MSDIDTIREALQWIISKSRSLGEYHSTLDPETAHGLIVEIPHECNEALAALDRLQAQQSNAEPVAWAYFGDFPDGKRLISADNTNLWGSDGIPLYTHPPASTEHPSYVYSRDYEALYDLLMRGGEALGLKDMPGKRHPVILTQKTCGMPDGYPLATFVRMCQGMNLEWIAPSTEPRLTVEQAMEVLEPFIEAEAEMEDGARWNWESKHKKYREMIEEIRDRLTKAATQST